MYFASVKMIWGNGNGQDILQYILFKKYYDSHVKQKKNTFWIVMVDDAHITPSSARAYP